MSIFENYYDLIQHVLCLIIEHNIAMEEAFCFGGKYARG